MDSQYDGIGTKVSRRSCATCGEPALGVLGQKCCQCGGSLGLTDQERSSLTNNNVTTYHNHTDSSAETGDNLPKPRQFPPSFNH